MRRMPRMARLLLGLGAWLALLPGALASPEVGQGPFALRVAGPDGQVFDLAQERGHVVLVNVWATWCVPCREEMPVLDRFYRQHRDRGLRLLGLSADRPRDRAGVQRAQADLAYPLAMAADASANELGKPRVVPVTYVFDATGVLRLILRPDETPLTLESLADRVLPLLPDAPGR